MSGRLSSLPAMDVLCRTCHQPRRAHGGRSSMGVCPGGSGIQASRFRMPDPVLLVVRDAHGEAWINLGNGRWAQIGEVARGKKYASAWTCPLAEVEQDYGPLTVEWSMSR